MHIIAARNCPRPAVLHAEEPRRLENERALLSILEEWSGDRTADEILEAVEVYTSKRAAPPPPWSRGG